jgi:hemerythrin superfamily protein
MDAIDLLERHHRQLEQRFSALKKSDRPSIEDFKAASDLLVSHMTIEERQFYPAVTASRTEDVLLESLEEHLSLKRVLSDLLALAADDPQFSPKMHVLAEQLEHHHKEEEDHLFPRARKLLDAGAREALGARMAEQLEQMKHQAPRELVHDQTDAAAPLPGVS